MTTQAVPTAQLFKLRALRSISDDQQARIRKLFLNDTESSQDAGHVVDRIEVARRNEAACRRILRVNLAVQIIETQSEIDRHPLYDPFVLRVETEVVVHLREREIFHGLVEQAVDRGHASADRGSPIFCRAAHGVRV